MPKSRGMAFTSCAQPSVGSSEEWENLWLRCGRNVEMNVSFCFCEASLYLAERSKIQEPSRELSFRVKERNVDSQAAVQTDFGSRAESKWLKVYHTVQREV